jgi:hypothetical protein
MTTPRDKLMGNLGAGEIEQDYARLVGAKRFEAAALTLDELLRRIAADEGQ